MTKKILSAMMALVMLFVAACQNELDTVATGGDTSVVTFSIETPELNTRAYSDGETATVLHYALFDLETRNFETETGVYLSDLEPNSWPTLTDKKGSVSFKLVTGNMYRVVFWAAAKVENEENAPYTFDAEHATVTVNYGDAAKCNDEARDAFFACADFAVDGNKTVNVKLTRPFAQLNIGTNDYEDAGKANVEPKKSQVIVKNLANKLNLFTGAVEGDVAVTFASADINKNMPDGFPVAGYEYLAMNYLLVNEKKVVDVEFTCFDAQGRDYTRTVGSVPVQRNYRTNIYGQVLTSTADLDVEIVPGYGNGDNNIEVWDGITTEAVEINETGAYEITNGAQLAWLAELVNGTASTRAGEAKYNIELNANIDLGGNQWTPIGTEANPFIGTFNGNGYIINNLKIVEEEAKEGKAYIGFFGYAKNATIENVTFNNVYINIPCLDIDHSQGHIGAVAGSLEGTSTIENVNVEGDVKVYATQTANGASRVAVVAGGNSYGDVTMKNVHVIANEGSYVKANNNTGALAGQLQGKMVFENCSSNIDVTVNKFFAGGLIGIAAGDSKFVDCHTTGNVAVVAGREGRANDHYRVGGIAGGWADGKDKVCTLTNCSYKGEISGTNADGSVAEVLDYAGYVGRGYTLTNCAGSKVVIDGVSYVQAFNDVYGIYTVDGDYEVGTATALKAIATMVNSGKEYFEGKTIKLTADIDLAGAEWTPIGSATKDHGFCGNFDGNGYTIKNLKITELTPDADGYAYAGLFGVTEGTEDASNHIKNLTIENVNISSTGSIVSAAIAYPYYTKVENITVKGNINITGADYVAGILAYTRRCYEASSLAIIGNEGSTITGNYTVGGVISDIQISSGGVAEYSNFSASGLTITANNMHVGGISGIIGRQTLDGASVENVTIVCADARKGTVVGSLGETSTIKNITVNNVTGATNIVGATFKECLSVAQNGDVFAEGDATVVYNGDTFVQALEKKQNVLFANDIKIEPASMSNAYGKTGILIYNGQTIDGGNYKLDVKGAGGTWDSGICTSGGLIKNIWVTGSFRGIFVKGAAHTEKIVLDNVRIEGTTYTISIDQASNQGLEATNSIFRGWTSYAATIGNVKFDGCTFGAGNGYNFSRPYAPTEYVNCNFEAGHQIDPRAAVTFENCTFNGVALTADNLATLVTSNIANATVK